MLSRIRNIIVVGKSDLSTAILHALSHASASSPSHNSPHDQSPLSNDDIHTNGDSHSHVYRDHGPSPYNLTLLTRPHQEAPSLPNLHHLTSGHTFGSLLTAFRDQHLVISTIAPADVPFQKRLINAAIAAGVKHFVPCEFSYDTQSPEVRNVYPPCAARYHVLEYLLLKGQEYGLRWTGIATGAMLENGLSEGLLGFDLTWKSATIYGTGGEMWPASTLRWVGEKVVELVERLQENSESKGIEEEYVYKPEFFVSQKKLLAVLEDVDGNKFEAIKADVDECVREGERRMEKGFFDGAMMLLERNVIFGGVGDFDVWKTHATQVESDGRCREVVRRVVETLNRDGRPDCGCG